MNANPSDALAGGFANVPIDAAHAFRAALNAMARPGTIRRISGALPPAPLSVAAGALILTLCDAQTPLFLALSHDTPAVRDWITFHAGAPFVACRDAATFALGDWPGLAPRDAYARGTPDYPDRSATLIVEMPALSNAGATLTGPGIETDIRLSLPEGADLANHGAAFPLGLDYFFTAGDRLAALPRSTRITQPTRGADACMSL